MLFATPGHVLCSLPCSLLRDHRAMQEHLADRSGDKVKGIEPINATGHWPVSRLCLNLGQSID